MKKIITLLLVLFLSNLTLAHIPELIIEDRNYTLEPVLVREPEISYAYYGQLKGSPQLYKIEAAKPFHLYVSLLAPYVGQTETSELEFHIMKDGEKIVMMHGYDNWTKFYEEYGGDWYLQGPSYEADAEAGIYLIEVHSKTNSEEYSLAIGKTERFGPLEIAKTILILPLMKVIYWKNYSLLLIYLLAIILIILVIYFLLRRRRKKKK